MIVRRCSGDASCLSSAGRCRSSIRQQLVLLCLHHVSANDRHCNVKDWALALLDDARAILVVSSVMICGRVAEAGDLRLRSLK